MITGRSWMLVAYPDSFPDMPDFIKYCGADRWAYCLHDKDYNDDGSPEKPHWQIYLHFENERQSNVIASMFHVAENNVEKVKREKNERACIQYLVHLNEDPHKKHHYDSDELVSFNIDVDRYLKSATESYQAGEIVKIIEFHAAFPSDSFADVVKECLAKGYYSSLRRGNAIFQTLWREARAYVYEQNQGKNSR